MVTTIARPGVQVQQTFQTVSPTILVPTLPACIVGPAKQIIEAVEDDGSLNSEALIALPARFQFSWVTTPFQYVGIGTDTLSIAVNNAAAASVVFPTGPNLTVDEVADAINEAEIPGLLAVVETSGSQKRVVVYTTATGSNTSLEIGSSTTGDVLTAFGVLVGQRNEGSSGYTNYIKLVVGTVDYPDPRSNIDELTIDYDSVRIFMNDGAGNVREVSKTETFLDGDTSAVTVNDDGDGDNLSPYLDFANAVFQDQAAVLTGAADLSSTFGALNGTSAVFSKNYEAGVTVNFSGAADENDIISQINSAFGSTVASLGTGNVLVLTSDLIGGSSTFERTGGTALTANLGVGIDDFASGKPGVARAQGKADATSLSWATVVHGRVLRMSIDGEQFQQLVMPATIASIGDLIAAINGLWGTGVATAKIYTGEFSEQNVILNSLSTFGGKESSIRIDKTASDATLLTALGMTGAGEPFETVDVVYGNAFSPQVDDEVWVDGVRLGTITEVPTTPTNRVRISTEQLLTFTGSTWYILAKGLNNSAATATRPSSDLRVDTNSGTATVKHELFRETDGDAVNAGPLATYLAYNALRKDVSPVGEDFSLLRFGTTTDLDAALSPLDTQNPLGLGMYFALLNAPGVEVTGLGVDETSDSEPEGSLDSYVRALEFLESKDVYAIAPLTHANTVGQAAQVHVDELSEPENGLERIVLLNPTRPTRKSDTLVASAATANVSGPPTNVVNTGISNLQSLLAAQGKPGPTYTESDGVYLQLEDDTNLYLVESVSGGAVTINDGPLSASNTLFYDNSGSPVFTAVVVDTPVSVFILGGSLGNLTEEATAYADIARGYLDRRVIATAPDTAKATIDGLETSIEGYYMACALAGKMSAVTPSQPLTEESLAGFTGVIGASDRYSELQLKILSGGGLWVLYQESTGQPIKTRHQLTTDMSTVEKREASITRALDFTAKFLRGSLRNFIGRFNLTTNIQDAISTTLQGLIAFLVNNEVLLNLDVNSIQQDANNPDTLLIDITAEVLYPNNYIKITLSV